MEDDIQLFIQLINELLEDEKERPIVKPIPTKELFTKLDLELQNEPALEEDFKDSLRSLVLQTPKTATKLFFNQLFGGRQSKAVLGDLLAVILNNSMYTYKVAGPQTGIEKEILNKLSMLCGYGSSGSGTIAPGGSMSNLMGMIMARDAKDPDVKEHGVQKDLIFYTSEKSHYSIRKNASFIGIGQKNVRNVPIDDEGKMNTNALVNLINEDIEQGKTPTMVNATAGTTVLGAFDPIEELVEICDEYNIWLHVDGAYCGASIFSSKYKHLIKGVEKSDSFSLNAHKMLMTPLTCSIFLTRHQKQLYTSFSTEADYLYQTDGDEYNLGKTSLQCGRRNDALKFWTLWKSLGSNGLENIVDQQFELADVAREYIKSNDDYSHHGIENSISICFNYKNYSASHLCTLLYEHSELMVGFGATHGENFIRLVTINANNDPSDIIHFFERLEEFCEQHHELISKEKLHASK